MRYGAGVLFFSPQGVLLLQDSLYPNSWQLPGGGDEDVDSSVWETARREVLEETGVSLPTQPPDGEHFLFIDGDFTYTTFIVGSNDFKPLLSHEHRRYTWLHPREALAMLPSLHPRVREVLEEMCLFAR